MARRIAPLLFIILFPSITIAAENETARQSRLVQSESDAMTSCYREKTKFFAIQTCEPATTVVQAAFGGCYPQDTRWKTAYMAVSGIRETVVVQIIEETRKKAQPFLISLALEQRIAAGACKNSN